MAVASDFTFAAYLFASQNAVNAAATTRAERVRDRFGNLVIAQPGDYILQDEDGKLRVMKKTLFESEYTAVGATSAPTTLGVGTESTTGFTVTWTPISATAIPYIEVGAAAPVTGTPNVGSKAITGLVANTGYATKVRNRQDERYSAYLGPSTFYTLPVAPATPTSPSKTHNTINIAWVNGDATAKTEVHIDNGAGGAFSQFGTDYAAGVTTAAITGLTPELPYKIKIRHEGAVSTLLSAFTAVLDVTTAAAP
jgi:hypothetical protein